MKKSKASPLAIIFISLGLILILAAALLAVYNFSNERNAGRNSAAALEVLEPQITVREKEKENPNPDEIPDYILNPHMDMPVEEFEGHEYIGVLKIPAIELELPILESLDYPNLKISPCRFEGSVYSEDMVIGGHDYKQHFGSLEKLMPGDNVIFRDIVGNSFSYSVEEIEILDPTEVEKLIKSDWDLSLFTCTFDGRARVTVRCMLDKK